MIELSIEPIEQITREVDGTTSFLKSLELLQFMAQAADIQLKIALDEFEDIYNLTNDKRIIDKVRSTVQQQQNVDYIFCGSHESLMNQIFLNKKSAFFHFSRIMSIGALNQTELGNYIIQKFNTIGIQINSSDLQAILQQLECHPYYSMKTMQILHSLAPYPNKIKSINNDLLDQSLNIAHNETKSYLEDTINSIKRKAHHFEVLLCIAKNTKSTSEPLNNYRVRQSLINMVIIKSTERGQYYIIDAFLKKYLMDIQ